MTVTVSSEYFEHKPEDQDAPALLCLTLHGYGSNPADMLRLTVPCVGPRVAVVSLQAPYPFYVGAPAANAPVGYNWGVRTHWQSAVDVHHRMVEQVAAESQARLGIGPQRTFLLGFSQPVGLNYRLAARGTACCRGIVGICGGVPRDWEEPKHGPVPQALLHISRTEDEIYPPEVAERFEERLRLRAADVEVRRLPGGHRFPSKARAIVEPWLDRVFGPR